MQIGQHILGERTLIVAEVGNNHEGNFAVAEQLVHKAAESGADIVKFQTFRTKYFTSNADPARFARLTSFELSFDQFARLETLARSLGIGFMSTPLDLESARFLEPLVDAYKVASGDNNFFPLLSLIAGTGKPVIVSSGLADLKAIKRAHQYLADQWRERGITQEAAVLHCVSSYPVPPGEANLTAIPVLARELSCVVGYSDHTSGPLASILAVALGARIIEKHFTLDKNFSSFRDHQLSADPTEMRYIVEQVRLAEQMLGAGQKVIQPSESVNEKAARRAIVAGADLAKGHLLAHVDLLWLRPFNGLPPGEESQVIGKTLRRNIGFGEPILPSDLE